MDAKTGSKRSWVSYSRKTLLPASDHFSTTTEQFQSYQAQQSFTTAFPLTTKTCANLKKQASRVHFTQKLQVQSKAFLTFHKTQSEYREHSPNEARQLFFLLNMPQQCPIHSIVLVFEEEGMSHSSLFT